ncbi:MAG: hypothetical protein ACYC6M_11510 [Terriglobales bacterium]
MPDREPSIIKEGGYQGSSDPGRPTQLMQQQTLPTPPSPSNGTQPTPPASASGE